MAKQKEMEAKALVREFEAVRDKYLDLLGRLIELRIPGLVDIDKVAAKCDVGEVCHGGTFATMLDTVQPSPRC